MQGLCRLKMQGAADIGLHLVSLQHHKACALSILLRNLLGFHSLGELHGRSFHSQDTSNTVGMSKTSICHYDAQHSGLAQLHSMGSSKQATPLCRRRDV